jgi:hypothetical protein
MSEKGQGPARLVGNSTIGDNIVALLTKRLHIYKRDKIGLVCEVCLPWVVVLLGCLATLLVFNKPQSAFTLVPSAYPNPQRIMLNQNNVVTTTNEITPQDLFAGLPEDSTTFIPTYISASNFNDFYSDIYDSRNEGPSEPYRYGSYEIYKATTQD